MEIADLLGLSIDRTAIVACGVFVAELSRWSARINLVSARGGRMELIERHVGDALAAAPTLMSLGSRVSIADLGSGAGLPGIPLAIVLRPERMVLVEARRRRASFLHAAARQLRQVMPDLSLEVENERIEIFSERSRGQFDAAVSRAALDSRSLLASATSLLRPGGLLIAYRRANAAAVNSPGRTGSTSIDLESLVPIEYRVSSRSPLGRLEIWRRLGP